MGRAVLLVVLLLIALGATWAASTGLGAARPGGDPEVRAGSVRGPAVVGRGPGVGK